MRDQIGAKSETDIFNRSKKRLAKLFELTASLRNIPTSTFDDIENLLVVSQMINVLLCSLKLESQTNTTFSKTCFIQATFSLGKYITKMTDPVDVDCMHALWLFVTLHTWEDGPMSLIVRQMLQASGSISWNDTYLVDVWNCTQPTIFRSAEKSLWITLDLLQWRRKKINIIRNEEQEEELFMDNYYVGKPVERNIKIVWDADAPSPHHKWIIHLVYRISDYLNFLDCLLWRAEDLRKSSNAPLFVEKKNWNDVMLTKTWDTTLQPKLKENFTEFEARGFKIIEDLLSDDHLPMTESTCEIDALQFFELCYKMHDNHAIFSNVSWYCDGIVWFTPSLRGLWEDNLKKCGPFVSFARAAIPILYDSIESQINLRSHERMVLTKHNNEIYAVALSGLAPQMLIYKSLSENITVTFEEEIASEKASEESNYDCVFCLERPATWIFSTCGHLCLCKTCNRKYNKKRGVTLCPICRMPGKAESARQYDGDKVYRC